jgi:predicted transcriptional regulator
MRLKPMVKSNKVQVTIQLDPDQSEAIDRIAMIRRTSRAAVAREAVDLFLSHNRSMNHSAVTPSSEAA